MMTIPGSVVDLYQDIVSLRVTSQILRLVALEREVCYVNQSFAVPNNLRLLDSVAKN